MRAVFPIRDIKDLKLTALSSLTFLFYSPSHGGPSHAKEDLFFYIVLMGGVRRGRRVRGRNAA